MSLIFIVRLPLLAVCILLAVAGGYQVSEAQDQPKRAPLPGTTLTHKSTFNLETPPQRVTLSPRGDRLLVHEFYSGAIKIFDLAELDAPPVIIVPRSTPGVDLVWSQDQTKVATRTNKRVQVFDSRSGVRLGEMTFSVDVCREPNPLPPAHGMGFTSDAKQIWVSCALWAVRSPSTAALRLTVSDMIVDDRLILSADDKATNIDSEVSVQNGSLILAYAKTVWASDQRVDGSQLSFGVHDLTADRELFPPMDLGHVEQWGYRIPYRALAIGNRGLLQWSLPGDYLDVFDLPVSHRRKFGSSPGKRSSPPVMVSPDGNLIYAPDDLSQMLRIWVSESGTLVSEIPIGFISCYDLSAAGSVMAVTEGNTVMIYHVE